MCATTNTRAGPEDSKPAAPFVRLRTLFALVGKTAAVNDAVLPAGLFPGLKKADVVSDRNLTLYALYQSAVMQYVDEPVRCSVAADVR